MSLRVLLFVTVAVAPWAWFVLRDRLGVLGDVISLGLPALAGPCLGALALAARWVPAIAVLLWLVSWALVFGVAVGAPRRPRPRRTSTPARPITVLTANARFDNPDPVQAARDVIAQGADVVVVPECTPVVARELASCYGHRQESDAGRSHNGYHYGVAVFSDMPLKSSELIALGNGVVRVEVAAPEPFVLFAVHLSRPALLPRHRSHVTHAANHREVVRLVELAEREPGPVVIAGDFNLSDRVRAYRLLSERFTDVTRSRWAASTFVLGWYRVFCLRIDHVFASPGWCGRDRVDVAVRGSDHRAIRTDIGPCRRHEPLRG